MTTGVRQYFCNLLGREPSDIGGCVTVHHKRERADGRLVGLDVNPAGDAVLRFHGELPPEELSKLRSQGFTWKHVKTALPLSARVERRHEARLLFRGPVAREPKTKRAVPPSGSA